MKYLLLTAAALAGLGYLLLLYRRPRSKGIRYPIIPVWSHFPPNRTLAQGELPTRHWDGDQWIEDPGTGG